MSQATDESPDAHESHAAKPGRPVVYVLPPDSAQFQHESEIDLGKLWWTLWSGKWVIAAVAFLVAAAAAAYVLLTPQWYRADVLLVSADAKSTPGLSGQLSGLGGLGGLAGLAGLSIGGGSSAEPLAVLTSRELTRAFIVEKNLLPVLFEEEWDARAGRWKAADPKDRPDIYDAIKLFDENIRRVQEDKKTNLITLSIEWKDPRLAAEWANLLVSRLNERMRQRAQQEADSSVRFLKQELAAANVVTLQQSVGRLLESELQKAMLARVTTEFAFRVVDRAEPPKWRSRPARTQIVVLAGFVGLLLGALIVLSRNALRNSKPNAHSR